MERGLLANIVNVPPLVFRFQYNPEILQEKKQFKYQQANNFGKWRFDNTEAGAAAGGFLDVVGGLWEDLKDIGPLLTATKPLEAVHGEPRRFSLEFKLDALEPGPDGPRPVDPNDIDLNEGHFGGSIEPDLAVLRSFMYPAYDIIDVTALVVNSISSRSWSPPCWKRPPPCTLVYGPLTFDCVMESLDIKVTDFDPETLAPLRADVSVTLAEQTHSTTPFSDTIIRYTMASRALGREGIWEDVGRASPLIAPVISGLGSLFD